MDARALHFGLSIFQAMLHKGRLGEGDMRRIMEHDGVLHAIWLGGQWADDRSQHAARSVAL